MSRFLLNLRQLDEPVRDRSRDLDASSQDAMAMSEVVFQRQSTSQFMANIGADLEFEEAEAGDSSL
jgi:hypothetical protein